MLKLLPAIVVALGFGTLVYQSFTTLNHRLDFVLRAIGH